MSNLENIESYITGELNNLKKAINRPRSTENTDEKISYFKDRWEEYDNTVRKYMAKADENQQSKLLENHKRVKAKIEEALNFLSNTIRTNTQNTNLSNEGDEENASGGSEEKVSNTLDPGFSNLFNNNFKAAFQMHNTTGNFSFPMQLAIQCIPEFNGLPEELDPFIYQIEYFAAQIPPNESHASLINVVLLKLKEKALKCINRIKGQTWPEVKRNLLKEFSTISSAEEILQKIETLEQGYNESFKHYKERALEILESIQSIEPLGQAQPSFPERSLKIHFLSGLRNSNLKQLAKTQRGQSFKNLLHFLQEECIECEQMEDIEQRLKSCRISKQNCNTNYTNFKDSFRNQTSSSNQRRQWQRPQIQNSTSNYSKNYNQSNFRNNFKNQNYHNSFDQTRRNNNYGQYINPNVGRTNQSFNHPQYYRNNYSQNFQQFPKENQTNFGNQVNPQNQKFNRQYNTKYQTPSYNHQKN